MPIISGFPAGGNAKFPEGGKTDQVLVKTKPGIDIPVAVILIN